ncbi:MAG: TonB-dependent receptor plug domain-containing protein [Opitutaceae bacterium]|nr:TonB-dependent receptor plug domain-containing protein [Opitutaceae bacterium]
MNSHPWISGAIRRLVLAQTCGVFGLSLALAQLAPTSAPSPGQLTKYDKNKNGVLDPDEFAAMRADQTKAANAVTAAEPTGETVQLSPFEVVADTRGYFASNTLSGTRLNSKIEDLGAAITVVTKQQLLDTAALDINDIFQTEIGTEGINQFTDQSVDFQGRVIDNVQDSPQTSNRVRGLSSANISTDGFTSSSRIPVDTYNLDSVEISRGPNSTLTGLGNAGGTVNLNQARANLTRETTQLVVRGDDWGGYRASLDLNRPLLKNKLGARVSAVYDSKGFRREPSEDTQRRLFGAVTYKPFASTTLSGSFESFRQFRRTPNASTPTDMASDWLNSGRPTWDPITSTAKVNGVPVATVLLTAQFDNNDLYPRGLGRDAFFDNMPSMFIGPDGRVALYTQNRLQAAGAPGTANWTNSIRLMTTASDVFKFRNATNPNNPRLPLDSLVGVSNRDIYDYENVNFVAPNWNRDQANTYKLQLEQKLFSTPLQQSFAQIAWRLEDSGRFNQNLINETTNLYIDVNERLLDGSVNPFFLRPYVNAIQRTASNNSIYDDTVRAQLTYALDLRKQDRRWLALLGRHQANGFYELNRKSTTNFNYRKAVTSNAPWINSANRFNSAHATITERYYVGDAVQAGSNRVVDYAPSTAGIASGTYTFRHASNVAGSTVTFADLPLDVDGLAFGGATASRLEVRTLGGAFQSYFWKERLVTTVGFRSDTQRNRSSPGATIDPATGFGATTNLNTFGSWSERKGNTTTYQGVLRPFRDWSAIATKRDQGGTAGYVAGLLDNFQVHYSYADSFRPEAPAYNLFGEELQNQKGLGRDWGFSVRTPDSKFVLRVSWFKTVQTGARLQGQFGLPVTILRGFEAGTGTSTLETFARNVISARPQFAGASEAQIQAAMYSFAKLPPGFWDLVRAPIVVTDVNNQLSKGTEIELNYNPSRNFRWRFTAAQTKAIDLTLVDATRAFIAQRLPVWTTITDDAGQRWWDQATQNINQYNAQIVTNLARMSANLGRPRTQNKEWTWSSIATYQFTGGKLNGLTLGSTIRWADKSSIGFEGIRDADGVYRTLDYNKPVYDPARASFDFMAGYNLRFYKDKVRTRIQLNCRDAFANRGLRATTWQPEGYPATFRIIDGRQWVLTTTFDL